MRQFAPIVLLFSASVFLAACSSAYIPFAYEVDIQQGNIITEDMVQELRPGMSRRQVRYVLGTPALEDPFHPNRWDYIHTRAEGGGGEPDRLTAFFDDSGNLVDLQGNLVPDDWNS